MLSEAAKLPDNVTELKTIIASYQADIKILKEQVAFYRDKLFGHKSEKYPLDLNPPQLLLFDEPEDSVVEESARVDEDLVVPCHNRKNPDSKPLPKNLHRVEDMHDLR